MSSPGAGLSRAALKKRKRQQKINTKLTGLQLPSITSDGLSDDDGDMQSGDDQHSASDSDAVIAAPRVVVASSSSKPQSAHKKSRKESWKFFNRESISHPLLASLSAFTIPKILALKNVKEATSAEKAAMLLSKLVYPMSRDQFYEEVFEKTPYCFKHDLEEDATIANAESKLGVYYGKLVTKKTLKTLLSEHVLPLGSAIRLITADNEYIPETEEVNDSDAEDDDSVDQTNKTTFLTGDEMWKKFMTQKHALEFLQPHVHLDVMWKLCSALEYEFGSRVDGKITLQPSNHNLTIPILAESDKFVLQLEGKTVWTISKPVAEDEEDIVDKKKGTFKPVTYELAPGQSLYVPKGYLTTVEGDQTQHSLFLTLLANHDHAPADLFKTVLPQAVENLVMESTIFKRSLPPDLGRVLGVACSENDEDPRRVAFKEDMNKLLQLVVNQAMDILDPAADQMAKKLIQERLPPVLDSEEEAASAAGAAEATIYPYTQLRMIRPDLAIAAVEDGKLVIYHCMDNSRELFGNPINPMEFELDDGPAIEALLSAYPEPVTVSDLEHPSEDMEDKVGVAQSLYKEGFLMIVDEASQPVVENQSDDDSDNPF